MLKKFIALIILLWLSSQFSYADIFEPIKENNKFTNEFYMMNCKVSSNDELPTEYCEFKTTDSEFQRRLKIVNWYNDFDTIMRFRMYKEIVWDVPLTNEQKELLEFSTIKINPNRWREWAYREITEFTSTFESWASNFLENKKGTEKDMKIDILRNLSSTLNDIQDYYVEWYDDLDRHRTNHFVENNAINPETFEDTEDIYYSNIDEIINSIKEKNYPNYVQWDIDLFENIYFPNVKKYLEIRREWTTFYRDFSYWNDNLYKKVWYSPKEIEKAKSWDYTNSYNNKVDYEYTITQTIWDNILNQNGWDYIPNEVIKEVSKLEMYTDKWDKDLEKDYNLVFNVVIKYVNKLKTKNKYSDSKVQDKLSSLKEQLLPLVEKYELKYNNENSSKLKAKYKNYVWLLLILEKVLSENNFS